MRCYSGSSPQDQAAAERRCAEPRKDCPLSKGGEKVNKFLKKEKKKKAICVSQWAVPWGPEPRSQPLRQLPGISWVARIGRVGELFVH